MPKNKRVCGAKANREPKQLSRQGMKERKGGERK